MIQNWFKLINLLDISLPNIVFLASLIGLFLIWKKFPNEVRFIIEKIFAFIIHLLPPTNDQDLHKRNPPNGSFHKVNQQNKKVDLEEELRNLDQTLAQKQLSVSPKNIQRNHQNSTQNNTQRSTHNSNFLPAAAQDLPQQYIQPQHSIDSQATNQLSNQAPPIQSEIRERIRRRENLNTLEPISPQSQFNTKLIKTKQSQYTYYKRNTQNIDSSNSNQENSSDFNPYLIEQQKNILGDLDEFMRKDSFVPSSQSEIQYAQANNDKYDYSPNACNAVFYPPIEVKGNLIPRFKQLAYLKNALLLNEVVFLIGPSGTGKTFLSTLCAKELRYAQSYSILSFSFSQQNNSLIEGLRSILIEQLKFPATSIQDPIQDFFKVLSEDLCLVIFRNIEFLSNNELLILCSSPHLRGGSRIIVISNHLSEKTLKQIGLNHLLPQNQNQNLFDGQNTAQQNIPQYKDSYWVELDKLDLESTQEYLLEKLPQALKLNSFFLNKLIRYTEGSPLLVNALCFFVIRQFRQAPWIKTEEIIKIIENTPINSSYNSEANVQASVQTNTQTNDLDSKQLSKFGNALMNNLKKDNHSRDGSQAISNFIKIIRLVLASLSPLERDILLFCAYTPLESFSASLIQKVFETHNSQVTSAQDVNSPHENTRKSKFYLEAINENANNKTDQNTEIFKAINHLTESGLIQKNHTETFSNSHFFINESVKNLIYRQFQHEAQQASQFLAESGINKITNYFFELLHDNEKMSKESISFISSGLLFSAKASLEQVSAQAHNKSIFAQVSIFHEKILDYFVSLGSFDEYIEKQLIPIYQEGCTQADSEKVKSQENKFQEIQALWQRLWAIALIRISEGRNIPVAEKISQINQAIELLSKALRTYLSGYAPINTAQIYNDLGAAHVRLSEAQKTEDNLILAVDYYKKALDIQESNKSPKDQNCQMQSYTSLGNAYLRLYKVKPLTITLNLAIQIFSRALKLQAENTNTINAVTASLSSKNKSAITQVTKNKSFIHQNIGNALRSLAAHEDSISNYQEAINNYKSALEVTPDIKTKAIIYNSLGGCLWKLAKYHNTVRNIELAISAYRKSLEFISHSWNPLIGSKESIEYATTQNNLGTCHKALASLKNPEENLSLAMKYFKESLYIAETTSQQRLVQVINQHLSELSNLADQMIFKKVSDSKLIEAQSQA